MSKRFTGVRAVQFMRCGGRFAAKSNASAASRLTLAGALAVVGLAAISLSSTVVQAQDDDNWFRFGGAQSHGGQSHRGVHGETVDQVSDAALAKQWEANPPKGFPTLSKENIGPMKAAVKRYTDIVATGGWRTLPVVELRGEGNHEVVVMLRQRLAIEGDLRADGGYSPYFDAHLERALKRFQVRQGLTPNGHLNKQTIAALNVPAAARLRQLKANLERLSSLAASTPKRYIVVNIPAAQIEAVEGDRVVSRHSAVVGKIDRQTPVLKSAVYELNFNPVWHLPPTVIEKDLIPKGQDMARSGKSVLSKFGIDAYDGNGKKLDPNGVNWSSASTRNLTFKQNPGAENPMGFVKINFANAHSVYMHDTPSQTLFGKNFRAASSGCVRVQNVHQLAAWILAENGDWTQDRVVAMQRTGERLDAKVKKPVPLYFAYITSWATEDGMVHFRRDLYQRDGVGLTASAY
jgi:L,D-transpeptidase YcbB